MSRVWNEHVFSHKNPLTPCVEQLVHDFMQRLVEAIGRRDDRFYEILIQVGSSFEGTRIGDPIDFDYMVELINFATCASLSRQINQDFIP